MSDLANGILVHHTSLGFGKVVAVEATAVHVFFPESEKRFAVKLRWPMARPFLKTEGLERDSWLEGLSSFSLDPGTGRYALAQNWLSHDQAVAEFLARCPAGFADGDSAASAGARSGRASRWRAAHAGWLELLGGGRGEALLADGNVAELVRRAVKVERLVAPIAGALDEGALREAFADPHATSLFFEALFGLLSVPSPARARFEKLFAATPAVGVAPGAAWGVATLFPFLADPGRHMLLRPKPMRGAAERLGCDLRYEPAPNWATYSALRAFAGKLLQRLRPMGARDLIDVEAFLHAIATKRPPTARREEPHGVRSRPVAVRGAGPARAERGRPRAQARRAG
jgi:hypothetical protein